MYKNMINLQIDSKKKFSVISAISVIFSVSEEVSTSTSQTFLLSSLSAFLLIMSVIISLTQQHSLLQHFQSFHINDVFITLNTVKFTLSI